MATSLLDGLKALLTPQLLATASRSLGESESSVASGLGASSASILAALAGSATTPQTMRPFFDLISSPANDGSVLRDPRLALTATPESPLGAIGGKLLSSLFGTHSTAVGDVITRAAGLRSGTGASLLNMAAPLVLGLLGNRVRTGGLDPAGLLGVLSGERDQIMRAVPAGLSSIPGLGSLFAFNAARDADIATPHLETPARPGWLWPALATLALLAVVWGMSRNRRAAANESAVTARTAAGDVRDTMAAAFGELRFRCGDQVVAVRHGGERTTLATDAGNFDLRRVEAASGTKYEAASDPSTTFWNRGDRATLSIKGKSYPECSLSR